MLFAPLHPRPMRAPVSVDWYSHGSGATSSNKPKEPKEKQTHLK